MANKIIVCQTGSRHRYLIPQVLERNGMLYRLYTDTTAHSFIGKVARLLSLVGINGSSLARLKKRIPAVPREKIYTTDIFFWRKKIADLKQGDSLKKRYLHYTGFVDKCLRWGIGDADCIYNMYIENYDFLVYAKSKGVKIVVDIYETPMTYKYLIDEIRENPEYAIFEKQISSYGYSHEVRMHYMEDVLSLADYYTIPSQFVINSMWNFQNFDKKKVIFLPYGSSVVPDIYDYHPVRHRLIWVGNDPVRKGLLYCAKAVDILKEEYPDIDFRVIGVVNDELKQAEAFRNLNFIGVLNKEQLMEEYRSAEAYVFPTLFEGFAGTVIEAASCGCPIITTECAGTDMDEFPALYIQTKDVDAIVKSVKFLFENQVEQMKLSKSVYHYSQTLNPKKYEERLVEALRKI
ncbi:MAG: glycosyltransferase family 4 protein [Lachnospiraceae bacterium]|nr:glycosyltransferase family 4 protein [Lachnospiraceae bacterium]